MHDFLAALSPEHLRLCISAFGPFGRQADTNISLTAAETAGESFLGRLVRDTDEAAKGGVRRVVSYLVLVR